MKLDKANRKLGAWRDFIARPTHDYAQIGYDAACESLSAAAIKTTEEWFIDSGSPVTLTLSARATPIDLWEAGEALKFAATIEFSERVFDKARTTILSAYPDFREDQSEQSRRLLADKIKRILTDPMVTNFTLTAVDMFELEDVEDLAGFISIKGHGENMEYQKRYGEHLLVLDIFRAADKGAK